MTDHVLQDCLEVASNSSGQRPAVLIYASHKRFGGGYLNHSKAQEEYCFNNTTLPLQASPTEFYPVDHRKADGYILPATIKKSQREVSFIFVPAPVWHLAKDPRKNRVAVLNDRAKLIFAIAQNNNIDHLILGGWGCGVFGCPPQLIVRVLKLHSPSNMRITYSFLDNKLLDIFSNSKNW